MNSLSLYHIFNVVAQKENISLAAKELFISQPAVSKSITKLEQELNITLFIRNSKGVTLTEEGRILYEYSTQAFSALKTAEDTLKHRAELGIGHISIGVSTTLCKYVLLPYLKQFILQYPHIKISIECQSTFHTLKLLEEKKLRLG